MDEEGDVKCDFRDLVLSITNDVSIIVGEVGDPPCLLAPHVAKGFDGNETNLSLPTPQLAQSSPPVPKKKKKIAGRDVFTDIAGVDSGVVHAMLQLKKMKRQETILLGLHYDILKQVMVRVARSSDGAKDFARAISVCKGFRQFVEDEDVLKVVDFDDLIIRDRWELFQVMGGLVCRSAKAGQVHAQFILGKVILVSTSQWVSAKEMSRDIYKSDGIPKEIKQGCNFLESFLHPETCTNWVGHHFDFVKIFLYQAKCCDLEVMQSHLTLYVNSFAPSFKLAQNGSQLLFIAVDAFKMARACRELVQSGALDLLNQFESGLPICQIPEILMPTIEFVTEVREEIRSAHMDAMVLEYNKLLKMLRALKAFTQRVIKALTSPQKVVAELNHRIKPFPFSQELEAILIRLKEHENKYEAALDHLKELEDQCLDAQEREASLVSHFERLFHC